MNGTMRAALCVLVLGLTSCERLSWGLHGPPDPFEYPEVPEELCADETEVTWDNFAKPFFTDWCTACHSTLQTGEDRRGAPVGVNFDTYAGVLSNPIDFTRARSLACGYPATPPSPGDFLIVEDTLPNPPLGKGYWYVTAVTHNGERRYGRQRIGGALTGRDPSLLPACEP